MLIQPEGTHTWSRWQPYRLHQPGLHQVCELTEPRGELMGLASDRTAPVNVTHSDNMLVETLVASFYRHVSHGTGFFFFCGVGSTVARLYVFRSCRGVGTHHPPT
jgi:hypothetical protein